MLLLFPSCLRRLCSICPFAADLLIETSRGGGRLRIERRGRSMIGKERDEQVFSPLDTWLWSVLSLSLFLLFLCGCYLDCQCASGMRVVTQFASVHSYLPRLPPPPPLLLLLLSPSRKPSPVHALHAGTSMQAHIHTRIRGARRFRGCVSACECVSNRLTDCHYHFHSFSCCAVDCLS